MLETDDLTTLTDQKLAKWHAEAREAHPKYEILAENEWRMRPIRKQHELNKVLVDKQSKLLKWSIIVGFAGMIIGAILGAVLTTIGPPILSKALSPAQKVSLEQPSPKSIESTGTLSLKQGDKATPEPLGTKETNSSTSSKPPKGQK